MSDLARVRRSWPIFSATPGLLLCIAISALGIWLASLPYVRDRLHMGALLLIILVGMIWRALLPPPSWTESGVAIAQRPALRWGVALLGFKISFEELGKVGFEALGIVLVCTAGAYFLALALSTLFGVESKFAALLGIGGAVCGASAIVAADSVVQADRRKVAASLGIITLLGTIGIFAYPIIGRALALSPAAYGVWDGASLHEMAQVVAAGQSYGDSALQTATIVKLARICLLAPAVLLLGIQFRHQAPVDGKRPQLVPWFMVAFLVFVGVNSFVRLPEASVRLLNDASLWLLGIGMAGVGLQTGFADLKDAGWRPLAVASIQWLVLAAASLLLAMLLVR